MGERGGNSFDNYDYTSGDSDQMSAGERIVVGHDEFDQPIYGRRPDTSRQKKQSGRRLSGKAIVAATAAAAVISGGLGAKALLDNGESNPQPTIAASTTSSHESPQPNPTPEDSRVSILQREYRESSAVLKKGPFLVGLTEVEKQRLNTLTKKLYDTENGLSEQKGPGSEFQELLNLKQKEVIFAEAQTYLEDFIARYEARFMGSTELKSGHKVNFYQIPGESGKQITVNPKALDAWEQWGIELLDDVYQEESEGDSTPEDKERKRKIGVYQQKAQRGELHTTINYFINPDEGDCFTKDEKALVPETANSCSGLGFAKTFTDSQIGIVGINSIRTLSTRSTQRDPNLNEPVVWIDGPLATLAGVLHEGVGHMSAGEERLFPDDQSDARFKRGFNKDHGQLTTPLTNHVIKFLKEYESNLTVLPPNPITTS